VTARSAEADRVSVTRAGGQLAAIRRVERRWLVLEAPPAGGAPPRMHARVSLAAPADAPDVVLVHGVGVSSRYMAPLAHALAGTARVWAPDLPGTGFSPGPRVLDVGGHARALAAFLDAARIGPAILVGNSMGCQVIARLAAEQPQRAAAVVLVGPTVDRRARSFLGQLWRGFLTIWSEPLALWLVLVAEYLQTGPWRTIATFRQGLAEGIEADLPRVRCPALVVRGAKDRIVPQAWAEEVRRLLPDGRLATLERAAHAVNFDAPTELARLVLAESHVRP
jgi:pimeloyl-ACP methyl ester carboxylesterase